MSTRAIRIASAVAALAAFLSAAALGEELPASLDRTAGVFVKSADAAGLGSSTLAVFPFLADESLTKKKVDVALEEILTQKLLARGTFRLVERTRLDAIMKEQKFALTGAVDTETAVKLGKLLGAKLLVLGSISRLGKSYQINARLVDAETGSIVASNYEEVEVSVFDEEAAPYLTLVPERQKIGIYLVGDYGSPKLTKLGPTTFQGINPDNGNPYDVTVTPLNQSAQGFNMGVGVRYSFLRNWMADLAYVRTQMGVGASNVFSAYATGMTNTSTGTGPNGAGIGQSQLNGNGFRVSLNWTPSLGGNFTGFLGLGYMMLSISASNSYSSSDILQGTGNSDVSLDPTFGSNVTFNNPFGRLGVEWRPLARFGVSVFGQFNAGSLGYTQTATFHVNPVNGPPSYSATVPLWKFDMPQALAQLALSLYF